jgi:hypothetical protein
MTQPTIESTAPTPSRRPRRSLRDQWSDLRARVDALPRAQRLAAYALLALLAWVAADELLWAPARAWAAQSERIEQALDRGAGRAAAVTVDLRRSVATFGPVDPPGPAATGREALARAIDGVMRRNKVAGYSYETRVGQRVKDPDAAALGAAVDRLQAEVKFEIAAEALPRLVAELEADPVIDGVTSIRIEKNDQARKLGVQATIESWVLSAGGRSAR